MHEQTNPQTAKPSALIAQAIRGWSADNPSAEPLAIESEKPILREQIRQRLERDVPVLVYLTEEHLAEMLHISVKTLRNRRTAEPSLFPRPMRFKGSKNNLYIREVIIDWLTDQEYEARTVRTHRC